MAKDKYDFSGWATKFDVKCSDGRTIKKGAFKDNHGKKVPLIWNHQHNDPDNVLGHAILEARDQGMYAYCYLNDTGKGATARQFVQHGDVVSLSIYANQLKQNQNKEVFHGQIKELSLVLAGANPGAHIDTVLRHDDNDEEEAIIYNDEEELDLKHAEEQTYKIVFVSQDGKESSVEYDAETEEEAIQKAMDGADVPKENIKSINGVELKHNKENKKMAAEKTVQDVFNELTEEQKNVVYAMIGMALEEKGEQGMKHNAFDGTGDENLTLSHAEFKAIVEDARKGGSLKDAFLAHDIENVDLLFPEVQNLTKTPETIAREMDWVQRVLKAVDHSPFSRVKSTAIDITAEEARARGYIKGEQKEEGVMTALRRTTTPQTIYKLKKMDRDDIVDITDFDVVAYIKQKMRLLLDEEIARAILIGDGRSGSSSDKINPLNIRPIYGDAATYTLNNVMTPVSGETDQVFAKRFIKEMITKRKNYKGSGNPVLFTTEDMLTNMLLIEDTNGRFIYDTIEKLTTALRVREIITVPVMEGCHRLDEQAGFKYDLLGIVVNLVDYNVGADKGGAINMFDDFDLNFNKYEYLIETRISGALVKPFSALTFELKTPVVQG